jgi:hypothetical protein
MHHRSLINRLVEDPLRHLIVPLCLALPGTAMAFVGTQPTGDTGYGTTTTDPTDTDTDSDTGAVTFPAIDTGPPACSDCLGAADLAGEQGGSSCSVAPAGVVGWIGLGLVAGVARRR